MKTAEQLYSQMEKLMDTLGIPNEIPKGSSCLKTVNALTRLLSVQRRYVWQ